LSGYNTHYGFGLPAVYSAPGWLDVYVPLWLLLLATGVPTALLFWRDRRRIPPGHCQTCGYDLTGNVSGRCPECGSPCPQQTTTSQ
jgi:hypothetical protein